MEQKTTQIEILRSFVHTHLPTEEMKTLLTFEKDGPFILYLVTTYNRISPSIEGSMRLITNPNALFISQEEQKAFMLELKNYIKDVLNTQNIGEVENVQNTDYGAQ